MLLFQRTATVQACPHVYGRRAASELELVIGTFRMLSLPYAVDMAHGMRCCFRAVVGYLCH